MMTLLSYLLVSARLPAVLISLLLPVLLGGCFWLPMSDWQYAVWSDDGEGVAFVQTSFEGQERIGHTKERSHEFEVYTSSLSSPDSVTQLAGPFAGNVAGLYFMGSAGYLVVGRTSRGTSGADDDVGEVDTWNYDLIQVDGVVLTPVSATEATSELQCEGEGVGYHLDSALDVIPSPDGSILAILDSGLSCDGMTPVQSLTARSRSLGLAAQTSHWVWVTMTSGCSCLSRSPSTR